MEGVKFSAASADAHVTLGWKDEFFLPHTAATKHPFCHHSPPVAGMQLCSRRGMKLKWDTQHLARMIDHVTSGQSEPAETAGEEKLS